MKQFKDISESKCVEIAKLAFGNYPDWITSKIDVNYHPYIREWYEDAREYFSMEFEGYFMGSKTTKYIVEIQSNLDVCVWYILDGKRNVSHCSNQRKIQELLKEYVSKTY